MGLIDLFKRAPCPSEFKPEVNKLIENLIKIGDRDDYLSEVPGSPFNFQCRHIEAITIGKRLHEIGDFPLMDYAFAKVRKKLGAKFSDHLDYAWKGIGNWPT